MNSNNLILIGLVVILAAGYLWWQRETPVAAPLTQEATSTSAVSTPSAPAAKPKEATTAAPAMTKEGIYLIYYYPSGFSPKSLEIRLGKSVRFVNQSGKAMRISSTDATNNPIYNAFNQPKTVGQGGVYEFTFTDRGTFSYQNLNATADRGSIIVK